MFNGWTWGEENPITTSPEEWTQWKYIESATVAKNTGIWGELELEPVVQFVSSVKDTGGYRQKKVTLSYDDYAIGTGSGLIYWRGSNTPFAQSSDEITGPVWQLYSDYFNTNFRYLQARVECG